MKQSAQYVEKFLNRPDIIDRYAPLQRERIIHLVSVHDNVKELHDKDELILMEADTLGALDASRVKPTFTYERGMTYLRENIAAYRVPRFVTEKGKQLLPVAMEYFRKYLQSIRPSL